MVFYTLSGIKWYCDWELFGMVMALRNIILLKLKNWITKWCYRSKNVAIIHRAHSEQSDLCSAHAFLLERAEEQGAVFARDIWSETNEIGIKFATVGMVRCMNASITPGDWVLLFYTFIDNNLVHTYCDERRHFESYVTLNFILRM